MAAHCHLLADACHLLPGVIDQEDGPLGCRHVNQHDGLAVMDAAAATVMGRGVANNLLLYCKSMIYIVE